MITKDPATIMSAPDGNENASAPIRWGGNAPGGHAVHYHESDEDFLNALESYVVAGLMGGESVILIVTRAHLDALEERLRTAGLSLSIARSRSRYIAVEAGEMLARIMAGAWPDEELFTRTMEELLVRARIGAARVRVFAEMVSLLWARGYGAATVRLEELWQEICHRQPLTLYCAYPADRFVVQGEDLVRAHGHARTAVREVCAHSYA